ncbi:hypothetical protein [Rahnella sp. R3(2024)]|uniref:hypothetical protein n=1 Tax=Rahnella sp. R3(2024) TaxID=3163550 RepID=UPI000701AAD1|nr:hypothetical protein ASE99_21290 [Serratia sp. Leaf51]MBB6115672.1 hypothetical protein [Rahnella inusitata]
MFASKRIPELTFPVVLNCPLLVMVLSKTPDKWTALELLPEVPMEASLIKVNALRVSKATPSLVMASVVMLPWF